MRVLDFNSMYYFEERVISKKIPSVFGQLFKLFVHAERKESSMLMEDNAIPSIKPGPFESLAMLMGTHFPFSISHPTSKAFLMCIAQPWSKKHGNQSCLTQLFPHIELECWTSKGKNKNVPFLSVFLHSVDLNSLTVVQDLFQALLMEVFRIVFQFETSRAGFLS